VRQRDSEVAIALDDAARVDDRDADHFALAVVPHAGNGNQWERFEDLARQLVQTPRAPNNQPASATLPA
jgi:hypothetical protein